jgi:hypothetical protein
MVRRALLDAARLAAAGRGLRARVRVSKRPRRAAPSRVGVDVAEAMVEQVQRR